ncbi:hypothetical protein AAF712_015543 [Marasmius tenuissimus]|uniref:Uncharacterized protein n=1 Tax=Marasmius tenuissimus TaxID=585030 RepID=A0ABR2Z943_9AGAR
MTIKRLTLLVSSVPRPMSAPSPERRSGNVPHPILYKKNALFILAVPKPALRNVASTSSDSEPDPASAPPDPTSQPNDHHSPASVVGIEQIVLNPVVTVSSESARGPLSSLPQKISQSNVEESPTRSLHSGSNPVGPAVINSQQSASELPSSPQSQFKDFPHSALLNHPDPYGLNIAPPPFMEPLVDVSEDYTSSQENTSGSEPSPSPAYAPGSSISSLAGDIHTGSDLVLSGSSSITSPVSSGSALSTPSTPSPATRVRYARTYLHGQRQHPTRARPSFGTMIAQKGSSRYEVVRTSSLVGRVDRKDMNRRFTRGLDRILLNCEKLADETGCWLYIATNHPSVHGEYVLWMSPPMRQDLPADTRQRFDKTAGSLFSALKAARRQNIVDVHLEASQCRAELDAAKAEAARKQALIDRLTQYVNSQGGDINRVLDS